MQLVLNDQLDKVRAYYLDYILFNVALKKGTSEIMLSILARNVERHIHELHHMQLLDFKGFSTQDFHIDADGLLVLLTDEDTLLDGPLFKRDDFFSYCLSCYVRFSLCNDFFVYKESTINSHAVVSYAAVC